MTVYTTTPVAPGNKILIPAGAATATIIAKGEGGTGAPVSGSTYYNGAAGGNTTFLGITAVGGGGAVTTTGGAGGGYGAIRGTVIASAIGSKGTNGGTFSSSPGAMPGGTGNPGGDGSSGGVSSYAVYVPRTCGGGFGYVTGGCGFYPACAAGFYVCATSFCCFNCAGPRSNVWFQTNTCCYNSYNCSYYIYYYTRGAGGGEGGYIAVTLDQNDLKPFLGTEQVYTVNTGASNLNNGSLEVTFTLRPKTPVWVYLSTGWVQMTDVVVNQSSGGWTVVNPQADPTLT